LPTMLKSSLTSSLQQVNTQPDEACCHVFESTGT